jgi:hypothetical protein
MYSAGAGRFGQSVSVSLGLVGQGEVSVLGAGTIGSRLDFWSAARTTGSLSVGGRAVVEKSSEEIFLFSLM